MNEKFTQIFTQIITDENLDIFEFRILCYLISCSNDGKCFPGISDIAEKVHISKTATKTRLKNLEEKKYITKSNRTIGSGKKTSNLYAINKKLLVTRECREGVLNVPDDWEDYDWLNGEE